MTDEDPWAAFTRDQMSELAVARELLAHTLWSGNIALLLGAGTSLFLGLPSWNELVKRAAELSGTDEAELVDETGDDLLAAMDHIRRQMGNNSRFLEVVKGALYRDLGISGSYPTTITHNPLLNALGALVMTSARGSAGTVLTLNFDDALEWYLELHGFTTQVLGDLPRLLDSRSDVHIYHVHGFLPLAEKYEAMASDVVLTREQYVERIAEEGSPWNVMTLSMLHSKIFLAVGTSAKDIDFAISFSKARKTIGGSRPLGFVIGVHSNGERKRIRNLGFIPVSVADLDDIPELLLSVCRRAAVMESSRVSNPVDAAGS